MEDKLDIGIKQLQEEIDKLIGKVVELSNAISNVKKLPFKANDTSGFNDEVNKTKKSLTELEKIEKQVAQKREKLALVTNKAYIENQKLNKSLADANKQIKSTTDNTEKQTKANKGLKATFDKLLKSMIAFIGVRMFIQFIKDTFELTKKLDSLKFAMLAITKSQEQVAKSTDYLMRITKAYGAEIVSTTERYIRFLAAAKQSNIVLSDTRNIFETFTKVAGVLGMRGDELNGMFLALEQMLSKGKVTTEELRRQLGERLPGAMGIMATALGVTIPKLDEMLKKGEVLSAEVLPEFARQVELSFGITSVQKVNTLAAAWTRLKNKWVEVFSEFSKSNNVTKGLTTAIDFLSENFVDIIKNVAFATKSFIAYKLIVEAVALRTYLLGQRTKYLALQQTALASGVTKSAFAWASFNKVLKANIIGIIVSVLAGIIWAVDKFSVSLEENTKALIKQNDAFLESSRNAKKIQDSNEKLADSYDRLSDKVKENNNEQESLNESITKNETEQAKLNEQIKKSGDESGELKEKLRLLHNEHVDLTDKTILFKDEQKELDRVTKALGTSFKDAVVEQNNYGDATVINTDKVRKMSKELQEQMLLQAGINVDDLLPNINELEKRIKLYDKQIKNVKDNFETIKESGDYSEKDTKIQQKNIDKIVNKLLLEKFEKQKLLTIAKKRVEENKKLIYSFSEEGIAEAKANRIKAEGDAKKLADAKKHAESLKNIENLTKANNKLIAERKLLAFDYNEKIKDGNKISAKSHAERILEINKEIKANQKLIDTITGKKDGSTTKTDSKFRPKDRVDDIGNKAEAERLRTLIEANKNIIVLESTTNEKRRELAEENKIHLVNIAKELKKQREITLKNDLADKKDKLTSDLLNTKLVGTEYTKLKNSTDAQLIALDKEYKDKIKISNEKFNQDNLDAKKYYADQIKNIKKGELDDEISENKANRDKEKTIAINAFNDRVNQKKLTDEEYKEEERKLKNELINIDIEFLEEQAKLFKNINPEKYNALMLAIADARKKMTPPDSASDFEKWVKKHEEGLKKIGELFNELSNLSNAFTEQELQNIERQREALDEKHESDIERLHENTEATLESIAQSDESAEEKAKKADGIRASADAEEKRLAKEKLKREEKLAKEEAKIKRKQAIVDKAAALANIAINTAVGISDALKKSFLGIPLVPVIAALGAVQAATVIATPIPQFAEGGEMTYDGDMMINDGGSQEYIERDGKILTTDKKDAIVKGKKGDVIRKDKNALLNSFSDNVLKASLMTSLAYDSRKQNTNELVEVFDRNFNKFEKSMAKSVEKGIGKMTINNNNFSSDYANYKASLEQ